MKKIQINVSDQLLDQVGVAMVRYEKRTGMLTNRSDTVRRCLSSFIIREGLLEKIHEGTGRPATELTSSEITAALKGGS